MSNNTTEVIILQGWASSPSGRGTLDVIYSCIITIFLCTWSVLCVNIGPPGERAIYQKLYKCKMALLCIIGSDFLLYLAVGQWESACRSCRKFRDDGYTNWTMKHAFFADMGGFTVRTSDGVSWPLDANQLHYMIKRGFIKEPLICDDVLVPASDIDDRNKQDGFVRVLTIGQVLWFLISCIARACQRLAITTLELTTIGFVASTIGVSIFWFHKPADVLTPRILVIDATVADIHTDAGLDHSYNWYETPLDFVDPERTYFEAGWRYSLNILRRLHLMPKGQPKPIRRRADDNFPAVSHRGVAIVVVAGIFSWGVNFVAWNFQFPSSVECYMWRASSTILISSITIGEIYQEVLIGIFPNLKQQACDKFAKVQLIDMNHDIKNTSGERFSKKLSRKWKHFIQWLPNNSLDHNPAMALPLVVLFPLLLCAGLFIVARAYILLEDLIALRAQPPDIYKTVDWSNLLPHI